MNQLRSHPFSVSVFYLQYLFVFRPAGQKEEVQFTVSNGNTGNLHFFRCKGETLKEDIYILLSKDEDSKYVGVGVIHFNRKHARWELLDQANVDGDKEAREVLGPKGFKLAPTSIVKRMVEIHG